MEMDFRTNNNQLCVRENKEWKAAGNRPSAYLNERVDCHDGHVGLGLCVVHQIQIDEFLELQIVGLHAINNIRKES